MYFIAKDVLYWFKANKTCILGDYFQINFWGIIIRKDIID